MICLGKAGDGLRFYISAWKPGSRQHRYGTSNNFLPSRKWADAFRLTLQVFATAIQSASLRWLLLCAILARFRCSIGRRQRPVCPLMLPLVTVLNCPFRPARSELQRGELPKCTIHKCSLARPLLLSTLPCIQVSLFFHHAKQHYESPCKQNFYPRNISKQKAKSFNRNSTNMSAHPSSNPAKSTPLPNPLDTPPTRQRAG